MKYYKRVKKNNFEGDFGKFYNLDKIFPENTKRKEWFSTLGATILNGNLQEYFEEVNEATYIIQETGKLPEKWCIHINNMTKEIKQWFIDKENGYDFTFRLPWYGNNPYPYFPTKIVGGCNKTEDIIELTTEQFKEYVMKENREIIGYKLKDKKYFESAKALSAHMCFGASNNVNIILPLTCSHTKFFRKEKVLDLWFEPTYKDPTPNITINGYKAEFFDTCVKFGYATIDKWLFLNLHNLRMGIGNKMLTKVTIGEGTFTMDQVKEIANYYLEK